MQIPLIIPSASDDLAYMAGIVDGEGTITALQYVSPKTGTRAIALRVLVANSSGPLMDWLHATFGGRKSTPRKPRSPKHKPVMCWYTSANQAIALCQSLLPYLKVKRRQAEIVLALAELPYERGNGIIGRYVSPARLAAREPLLAEMRALNQRGLSPDGSIATDAGLVPTAMAAPLGCDVIDGEGVESPLIAS